MLFDIVKTHSLFIGQLTRTSLLGRSLQLILGDLNSGEDAQKIIINVWTKAFIRLWVFMSLMQ